MSSKIIYYWVPVHEDLILEYMYTLLTRLEYDIY